MFWTLRIYFVLMTKLFLCILKRIFNLVDLTCQSNSRPTGSKLSSSRLSMLRPGMFVPLVTYWKNAFKITMTYSNITWKNNRFIGSLLYLYYKNLWWIISDDYVFDYAVLNRQRMVENYALIGNIFIIVLGHTIQV